MILQPRLLAGETFLDAFLSIRVFVFRLKPVCDMSI